MAGSGEREMPEWRPAPAELKRRFEEAIRPLPGAELRKMFGYPCAFYNGQMFAGIFQESIMVRLPEDERGTLLALPGAAPFEPMPGRPMREYVVLPESVVLDPAGLDEWLHKGLAYAAGLPPKPARAPGTKKRGKAPS